MKKSQVKGKTTRRSFIADTGLATAAFTIVPRHVLGGTGNTPPSEQVNIAGVGIGGVGKSNVGNARDAGANVVALCDVDSGYAGPVFIEYPKAKKYKDYRRMLEEQKDIDGVIVATPDHTHAIIAMAAIKMGKHVYVQKPLSHTVKESRLLTEAAREAKVATQMGNQGHSTDDIRRICEWIWDGAIGPVREVHVWTDRAVWPQGFDRPTGARRVPATLDWDLWLGPAPERPYMKDIYHPVNWRCWWDFGTGALGDHGCHALDSVFWALNLKYPTSVEASSSNLVRKMFDTQPNTETFPRASIVYYNFPARGDMPEVQVKWFDGGLMPPRPEELEPGFVRDTNGVLFIGDKGKLMCGGWSENPRLIPETRMKEYQQPSQTIERIEGSHEADWIRACQGGEPASANFEYSGPMSEMVLMGNLAVRSGKKVEWDGENMQVTNHLELNEFVHREYRKGWTL
jgi:predicted dehydrogenase